MFDSLPLEIRSERQILPDPFTTAPTPEMLAARAHFSVPAGFVGRAAVMIENLGSHVLASFCLEQTASGMAASYRDLSEALLWPALQLDEVPNMNFINGHGQQGAARAILQSLLDEYPVKPYFQGGREIQWRKGQLCRAFAESMTDPAMRLLAEHNRNPKGALIGLGEWWCGASPAHEMRFDGTFYAPRACTKFLYAWLVDGVPHEEALPLVTEETIPHIPVLYEDRDVIVVNKPTRLSSVPGIRETISCMSVLERTKGQLFVVHRLDLDTSGVIAFARNTRALAALNEAFRSDLVMKRYVARLDGSVRADRGTITLPLSVNRLDRPRQCVLSESAGGKACATDYEVISRTSTCGRATTLVNLYPATGRTHQLRVHCSHAEGLGCPIDGDPFYSRLGLEGESADTRLCLHAAELTLPHPASGEILHIEAPQDFPDF